MSPAEIAEFMTEHLKRRYGDAVEVQFVDLAEELPTEPKDRELREKIISQGMPLPLVAINGIPKMVGILSYRMITEAIDTLTEVSDGQRL